MHPQLSVLAAREITQHADRITCATVLPIASSSVSVVDLIFIDMSS